MMKKLLTSLLKNRAGFTMIELLIVIAILGILAVAVLSAINPIEQINRGRDTGSRSDAEQLLTAIERFQAFQGYYPWMDGPSVEIEEQGQDWYEIDEDGVPGWLSGDGCSVLERLGSEAPSIGAGCLNTDELKLSFINRITDNSYNHMSVYNSGAQGASTYICFTPQSNAFRQEADARCVDENGSGLPQDMQGIAEDVCGGESPMVCLP